MCRNCWVYSVIEWVLIYANCPWGPGLKLLFYSGPCVIVIEKLGPVVRCARKSWYSQTSPRLHFLCFLFWLLVPQEQLKFVNNVCFPLINNVDGLQSVNIHGKGLTGYCVHNNVDANCKHLSSPKIQAIFKAMSVETDALNSPNKTIFRWFLHILQKHFVSQELLFIMSNNIVKTTRKWTVMDKKFNVMSSKIDFLSL